MIRQLKSGLIKNSFRLSLPEYIKPSVSDFVISSIANSVYFPVLASVRNSIDSSVFNSIYETIKTEMKK